MIGTARGPRINPMLAGVIAGIVMLFIVGVMAKINIDFAAPWAKTHTLTVVTTDADGIGVSSDVRINGRLVGQVTATRAVGPQAEVTIHVDDSEWPLPDNTTASVRLATLLGQKYIELQTTTDHKVTSGGQLQDNARIENAQPVVDFDQILSTFDKPTRDALTGVVRTLGGAVGNQEAVLQSLLLNLRDLSTHSVVPTGELAQRDDALNRILINLGITADQLNQSRDDLAGTIDNFNKVTGALATHQDALRGFIVSSDQINQTTHQILGNGFAPQLASDLTKLNTLVHDFDNTFATILPQSKEFQHTALKATLDLIYEIGDATSQSDKDGYMLRVNLQGLDASGLLIGGASSTGPGASKTNPSSAPCLPAIPGVPAIPGLTCPSGSQSQSTGPGLIPPLGNGTGGGSSGGSGGTGGRTCILGILCTSGSASSSATTADAQYTAFWENQG